MVNKKNRSFQFCPVNDRFAMDGDSVVIVPQNIVGGINTIITLSKMFEAAMIQEAWPGPVQLLLKNDMSFEDRRVLFEILDEYTIKRRDICKTARRVN